MNQKFAEILRTISNSKPLEIPPFSEEIFELVKQQIAKITLETKTTVQKRKALLESNQYEENKTFIQGKLACLYDQLYRIKRFLLIYADCRTKKIDQQFWHFGGDLKNSQKTHLSEKQKKYLVDYKALIMDYSEGVGLDITCDLDPPLQSHVSVKFEEDCGQILNETGQVIRLAKNEGGFMKKRVVQTFLKQGKATIRN